MTSTSADPSDLPRASVSRRGLLAGAGAAVLASSLVGVPHAQARPAHLGNGIGPDTVHPDGAPMPTGIGSAPISGYDYRSACMYDFRAFDPTALVTWGGYGVYTATTASDLRASFDVPAGALVRDIEWYVYNNSANAVICELFQFAPGFGTIFGASATVVIPGSGSTVVAVRAAVPSSAYGPFPVGSKLLANLHTPTDATIQVNGVRLGFSQGVGATALLPTPIRAYDSRSTGGALSSGSTRTITLPASAFPAGASAALINLTAVGGTPGGYLKVYAADASVPAASALNYGTTAVANALTVSVSSSRQIKVFASRTVNVIVDVTGYVA